MDKVLNLAMLKHPMNWVIVWTVLLIGAYGWHILHDNLSGGDAAVTNGQSAA